MARRKLKPYTLDEIHDQIVIGYIIQGVYQLQDKKIRAPRVIAELVGQRTGRKISATLIDRLTSSGKIPSDTRKKSGIIHRAHPDHIEDFCLTFGEPYTFTREFHKKTYDIELIDVPYLKEDFAKISVGLFPWRSITSIDRLIPETLVHPHGIYAKQGILTNDFFDCLKTATNLDDEAIVEASIALAYQRTEDDSKRVYANLQAQTQKMTHVTQLKPSELGSIANLIKGLMLLENLTEKEFARLCGVTMSELTMILETTKPLEKELIDRLGVGLSLIRPKWSGDALARLELPRVKQDRANSQVIANGRIVRQ